eukprot:jgi/Chlat1/2721/Chrsp182S02886
MVGCAGAPEPPRPLVVVGSLNADLYIEIHRMPRPGETLPSRGGEMRAGGKGANQAAAAGKLGWPTYMIGQVGSDTYGDFLRESLTSAEVGLSHVASVDGATGLAVILLQAGGENSILLVGGANQAWEAVSPSTHELLSNAGVVLLQMEIPESVNISSAQIARAAGAEVVLDAGGSDEPPSQELLRLVTILSPNETELSRLTGRNVDSAKDAVEAAKLLLQYEDNLQQVLVKLGSKGSLLVRRDEGGGVTVLQQEAVKVQRVVDTTGAGDCFTAAYAVALLQGKSPQEALQFASVAAALCIQQLGAMPSLPWRHEVDKQLIPA